MYELRECHTPTGAPFQRGQEGRIEARVVANLVVDIVAVGGISAEHLERVERKGTPAVVADGLAGQEGEEEGSLSDGEAHDGLIEDDRREGLLLLRLEVCCRATVKGVSQY